MIVDSYNDAISLIIHNAGIAALLTHPVEQDRIPTRIG